MAGKKSLALSLVSIYETLAISWPTVLDGALKRARKDVYDERLRSWAEKLVAHTRVTLDVVGRDQMEPGRTYLVMSNHQSHYDIPILFHVIGPNIRMIAKQELFDVPIFGTAIREAGFISIDRSNRHRAIESLATAKKMIENGVHVWIAPEGTRSRDGNLLPFKKGGFTLALESGLPVLPVSISGTKEILPAQGVRSSRGAKVRVVVHAPIDPGTYEGRGRKDAREQLMADVKKAVESGL